MTDTYFKGGNVVYCLNCMEKNEGVFRGYEMCYTLKLNCS